MIFLIKSAIAGDQVIRCQQIEKSRETIKHEVQGEPEMPAAHFGIVLPLHDVCYHPYKGTNHEEPA
jgi:hypothetical protein